MWAVQNTPTIFGGSFKQTKEKAESATRFDRTWRENIIITCHVRLLTRHQWLIQRTCWTLRFLHSKKGFSWPSKYTLHIVQFSLLARTFHPPTCIRKSIHSLSRSRNVSIFHRIFPWARAARSLRFVACWTNTIAKNTIHFGSQATEETNLRKQRGRTELGRTTGLTMQRTDLLK